MDYRHQFLNGGDIDLPVGKVVCVGRNYADHAKELNNPVPAAPILFMKPAMAVVSFSPGFSVPMDRGECHHETEIALLIAKPLTKANPEQVCDAILGLGIGLDLTLRDLQTKLKEKGHPWEQAKAFDGACPLSPFVPIAEFNDLADLSVSLQINDVVRQQGNSQQMLTSIVDLVVAISQIFTLQPGDVVLTGTPAGVGPLQPGDRLVAKLADRYLFESMVTFS